MHKKIDWLDIVLIALFVMAVYFILTRIFGHSAADLTISVTLFTFLGGLLYKLNRELGEFKIKTKSSFERLKEDIGQIKEIVKRK